MKSPLSDYKQFLKTASEMKINKNMQAVYDSWQQVAGRIYRRSQEKNTIETLVIDDSHTISVGEALARLDAVEASMTIPNEMLYKKEKFKNICNDMDKLTHCPRRIDFDHKAELTTNTKVFPGTNSCC